MISFSQVKILSHLGQFLLPELIGKLLAHCDAVTVTRLKNTTKIEVDQNSTLARQDSRCFTCCDDSYLTNRPYYSVVCGQR